MTIDIQPDHLRIVWDILKRHVPGYEILIFGSRAKGTAQKTSDLDLCIKGDQLLSLTILAYLRDDFSESNLPYKVDVVDWAATDDRFKEIIERQSVPLTPHTTTW